jgi:hypothetical protein
MSNKKESHMFETTVIADTISGCAVIGINAGYGHKNESDVNLAAFGETYKAIADATMESTSVYVGTSISPCKVVYKTEWGCPVGGENAVRVAADCNPSYSDAEPSAYIQTWKNTFLSNTSENTPTS